ncbi:hypothetical protein [Paraburkholderia rhynchosiae]|uniref:Uncharacterized protein n=1 Tax=Paraburkholderia rhynchosiae TaxID=487049 RepID=A0A2N7W5Z1_9BURK|nr:hypothetical protein [Paraburkholderia rhynchosiae]PMS24820.1 hypothetical protein C0Z16_30225 [Paraburkholderia rhynchosiae]CAB3725524.1 hypothetical protein LMG27174_05329 [Paraburkholderia rhynchosiae]
MSIQRIGSGYTPPDLTSEADAAQQQQTAQAAPQHHRHHALTRQKRSSLRKRRSAESPDANDPAAESEELLMMLDQHLRRDQTGVFKVDARDSRGGQQGFGQDDHSAGAQTNGKHAARDDQRNLPVRELPMRLATRDPRDESALSRYWRAATNGNGDGGGNDGGDDATLAPGARAEAALVGMHAARARRTAGPTENAATSATTPILRVVSTRRSAALPNSPDRAIDEAMQGSPTYQVLAIIREFLRMPDDSRTSRATLAQVRERLVAAATRNPHDTQAGDARGVSRRPLSPAEESMNLLLPLALLNLGRGRTRAGRAMGVSALAALIRRGRGW